MTSRSGSSFVGIVSFAVVAAVLAAAACGGDDDSVATSAPGPISPGSGATAPSSAPSTVATPGPSGPVTKPGGSPPGRPSGTELRQQERSQLPGVTAVERWHELATAGRPENFAPSVVRLPDGRYRMYVNGGPGKGIVSYVSNDGLSFTPEEGMRLTEGAKGALDCAASHPWVVPMAGGYRMYYQGDSNCVQGDMGGQQHAFRIFSAFSSDGLAFEREGVRVETGGTTGLTEAAHGRVLRLADSTYRMYFSAGLAGRDGPSDIVGASSRDGLTWTIDTRPVLEDAHDPTVIRIDGVIYIYATFLGDNFVVAKSTDGISFTPTTWIEFYSRTGTRIEEFGDVDVAELPDDRLALYGSGKGSKGVSVMVRE